MATIKDLLGKMIEKTNENTSEIIGLKENGVSSGAETSFSVFLDGGVGENNSFVIDGLYYDDGTQIRVSNCEKLLSAINNGTPIYLYSNTIRLGEILRVGYDETSSGYKLHVWGMVFGLYSNILHTFYYTTA